TQPADSAQRYPKMPQNMMARTALISCLLLVDHAEAFVVPAGRTSFRHHHTGDRNTGPAAAAVGLRPAYATPVAAGVEGAAAAERLVSSYAATRSTARMGIVGARVGRAVGRGLAAAAFAT
ncbi:unnamed protein product, partial [Ectocarpus fasciculatus]